MPRSFNSCTCCWAMRCHAPGGGFFAVVGNDVMPVLFSVPSTPPLMYGWQCLQWLDQYPPLQNGKPFLIFTRLWRLSRMSRPHPGFSANSPRNVSRFGLNFCGFALAAPGGAAKVESSARKGRRHDRRKQSLSDPKRRCHDSMTK